MEVVKDYTLSMYQDYGQLDTKEHIRLVRNRKSGQICVKKTIDYDYLSTATISAGKKIKGAIYYEVPSNSQELKLEYEVNYFTEDKIIFNIK